MEAEKKVYELKIDEEFKNLIPSLTSEELELLEENIKKDGCREPLCVWNNIIVDGHNRYSICRKNNIPFHIQQMDFYDRVEVQNWICMNQLGRRNISPETRKYLIGKRYQMEKIILNNPKGKNQYSKFCEEDESVRTQFEKGHYSITSIKLGREYQIGCRTVMDYGNYANSLDILRKKEPQFVEKVLNGEIKVGQQKIINLAKMSPKIRKIEKHINANNKHNIQCKKRQERKASIKDMPQYDPDAEIVSLSYTIPSWVGSIDRVLGKVGFENVSNEAKVKLRKELEKLDFTVETLFMALDGE